METPQTERNLPSLRPNVIAELHRVADENEGILRPRDVVDEATPEESPLHPHFEWEDEIAADKFRLFQAAHLIRRVRVVQETKSGEKVSVRAFVSLPSDRNDGGGYRSLVAVRESGGMGELLAAAKAELAAFRNRYAKLEELGNVFHAIDEITG
jgi:hypothetical protein